MTRCCYLCLALALGACRNDQPPPPTAQEAEQLDEAEAMLNELGNEKGPEADAPGPSQ